ncbi:Uncharacterized phage protein gp47/JayE [Cohnella sp. OV330]|uniref:baseplate J/gp47 family protein n=1 Tax=Cohnella sp. OV330 TaxID=1855288 RepID=UPI0008E5DE0A|nr:baseplate J/gp47 family protein [Cohnella sp. OV330]SFB62550.1 Uncharacterized phage protein gp47/JayE [Cohnella sp. OV330]
MAKEEILSAMLLTVSDSLDKRPGSFIYDALAPVAERLADTDEQIASAQTKLVIDNLTSDELTERVRERTGMERKAATRATGVVTLTGTGTIVAGDLFETAGGVQFKASENAAITITGNVQVEAVIAGSAGVVPAGAITLFPVTLAGFSAVTNASPTEDGFDQESDADLIVRYYERIRTPATSGNKAHYLNWAKEIAGVGDARVIPLWNGPNTVKIVLIDSDKTPASAGVVDEVQNYIDPGISGLGDGQAPIGAFATVVSAAGLAINVTATIHLTPGYSVTQAKTAITSSLTALLKNIAFVENIVSVARIGAAILTSEGVADYSGLTVNGGTANIAISSNQVAVLGTVTVNV